MGKIITSKLAVSLYTQAEPHAWEDEAACKKDSINVLEHAGICTAREQDMNTTRLAEMTCSSKTCRQRPNNQPKSRHDPELNINVKTPNKYIDTSTQIYVDFRKQNHRTPSPITRVLNM